MARKSRELSDQEWALLLPFMPERVVSEILSGKRRLNTRQMKALGKRFGVSPVVFMSTTPPESEIQKGLVKAQVD
ncbi:hypothetical protein [Desulfobacter latus]|uniref:Uncharacterized protein n=1 Tax=Desulfobacter latus TaxID=2292 RepID=A0A850TED6_9BACT|nr:hypothetical protein [Desulfobacter latus]NWH06647.1 hypothetical protein [Desulfobacter latus]